MQFGDWISGKEKLHEISGDDLSKVGAEVNRVSRGEYDDQPFGDLFGGVQRVVIPLMNEDQLRLENALKQLGYIPDLSRGVAVRGTYTKQVGMKHREERIGRVLAGMAKKDPDSGWSELSHWWETNKKNIGTGGAIAYLVRTHDLERIANLQAKDIFKDTDRDKDGIEPLERVRLRRFTGADGDLLIPEKRLYGIPHTGFLESVMSWSRSKQLSKFANTPDFKDYQLRGGSYQDNPADELWNRFFGTSHSGDKKSIDQDAESEKAGNNFDEIYAAAHRAVTQHAYNHYGVYVSEEPVGDGENVLGYNAHVRFSFPLSNFIRVPEDKDIRSRSKIGTKIVQDTSIYNTDNIDCWVHDNWWHLDISIYDDESTGDLDRFEHFLDEIDGLDRDYLDAKWKIETILHDAGFMKSWIDTPRLANLKHFPDELYDEDDPMTITSEDMWIGDLQGMFTSEGGLVLSHDRDDENKGMILFQKYQGFLMKGIAGLFPGRIIFPSEITLRTGILPSGYTEPMRTIQHPIPVYLQLEINAHDVDYNARDKFLTKVLYIDKNWDYFQRRVADFWFRIKSMFRAPGNLPMSLPIPPRPDFEQHGGMQQYISPPKIKLPARKPTPIQQDLPFPEMFSPWRS